MASTLLRNICFTINNYTLADFSDCEELVKICEYVVIGFEIGQENTPHLQGYAELTKRTRFGSIKKLLKRAHFEGRKGTQAQAADYCKKEENWLEWGKLKRAGERRDLHAVKQMAEDEGMRGVVRNVNTLQGIRVAEKYLEYNEKKRDWKPCVVWIWGETGTGKSRMARDILGDDVYTKNSGTKWWTGYDAHEDVIIDDFRDSWWSITEMLSLLDRYEKQIETKGGQRQFLAKNIVITSAFSPQDCYMGTGEAIQQLLRRIDIIEHLVPGVPDVPEVGGNTIAPTCGTKNEVDFSSYL